MNRMMIRSKVGHGPVVALITLLLLIWTNAETLGERFFMEKGDVKIELSIPGDAENYRGTRFDHSGIFQSIHYKGTQLCERWQSGQRDPDANDDVYGPCEEFGNDDPLGYETGKPGSRFVKIGVGILIQPSEPGYKFFHKYEYAERGKWTVEKASQSISFTQELVDNQRESSIGYLYTKTIRLKTDGWVIDHDLKNIGKSRIQTHQYNHNFFLIDGKSVGPEYGLELAFSAVPTSTNKDFEDLVQLKTNRETQRSLVRFQKDIGNRSYFARLDGHSNQTDENQWTLVHAPSNIRIHAVSSLPLAKFHFWGTSRTVCPEPYVLIDVAPDQSIQWHTDYTISQ